MTTTELLVTEFDGEMDKTRATLKRVPQQADFKPQERSMPLGRLAALVAQLPAFATHVLTLPELNFATAGMRPLEFESAEQLLKSLDQFAGSARSALVATSDEAWTQPWKLAFNEQVIFAGSRFLAYRFMFLNHLVHHRGQLSVYLRMTGQPVPAIYGPSADEA